MNLGLLFHPRGGAAGWVALPFIALFELLGPLMETTGYLLVVAGFSLGLISGEAFVALISVAVGLGIMVSLGALLLEELSFRVYRRPGQLALLVGAALIENLGYRQLVSFWRMCGLFDWLTGGGARRENKATPASRPASRPPAGDPGDGR